MGRIALHFLLVALTTAIASLSYADQPNAANADDQFKEWKSAKLQGKIITYRTVFPPREAEYIVLPMMKQHASLFKDKKVLEIGTGSGIISIYAAKLGAKEIVATDINPNALRSLEVNAMNHGVADRIDPRLVSEDNMGAFAVIKSDEKFDIIISNPPYALNLDRKRNTPGTDKGDLGLSIVDGLEKHLNPNGSVVLYYGSLFYHQVMVKYARYKGYEVRNHIPVRIVQWEARTLFNSYLKRLLKSKNLRTDLFEFKGKELVGLTVEPREEAPLFPESGVKRKFPGFLVIEH